MEQKKMAELIIKNACAGLNACIDGFVKQRQIITSDRRKAINEQNIADCKSVIAQIEKAASENPAEYIVARKTYFSMFNDIGARIGGIGIIRDAASKGLNL